MAVWQYRGLRIAAGLHQFYEPLDSSLGKTSPAGWRSKVTGFNAEAVNHAVFKRVVPGGDLGVSDRSNAGSAHDTGFHNTLADKQLLFPWQNTSFWVAALAFIVLTALLSGSYPALYLSAFQPLKVLKGTFRLGRFTALPRRVLVVVQFTISVTLVISTIVVFRQVQYTPVDGHRCRRRRGDGVTLRTCPTDRI